MLRHEKLAQLSKSGDSSLTPDGQKDTLFGRDDPYAQAAYWLNSIGNHIREYSAPDRADLERHDVVQLFEILLVHIKVMLERLSQLANDGDSAELVKEATGLLVQAQSELTLTWSVIKNARTMTADAATENLGFVCKQLAEICCPRLQLIGAQFAAIFKLPSQGAQRQSTPSEDNDEALSPGDARALFDEMTRHHYRQSASVLSQAMTTGKLKFVKKDGTRCPLRSSLLLLIEDSNRWYAKKGDTEYDPLQVDD